MLPVDAGSTLVVGVVRVPLPSLVMLPAASYAYVESVLMWLLGSTVAFNEPKVQGEEAIRSANRPAAQPQGDSTAVSGMVTAGGGTLAGACASA